MATFVLVHPAWFGGWCWGRVASRLRAAGHEVHAPTLTGLGERAHVAAPGVGLGTHVDDVVSLLEFEDLRAAVLVGTSSGGTVAAGVADRAPDRVERVVYLDAFVPMPGQSTLDMIIPERRAGMAALVEAEGDGWLAPRIAPPPWERILRDLWQVTAAADLDWALPRLRPTPFGHFTEPVRLSAPVAEGPPPTYVRCVRFPNPAFDRFAATARSDPAWGHRELDASHLPYVTSPDRLAALLGELSG